jgi:hypothetical protein
MKHEMQPDSLVDLKFIMADTGFGKTFIYDRIKSGDLPKPNSSTAEQGGYIVTTASSEKSSCPAPMGKVTSKIFFTRKKTPYTSTPAYQVRCMQGTPCPSCFMTDPRRFLMIFLQLR